MTVVATLPLRLFASARRATVPAVARRPSPLWAAPSLVVDALSEPLVLWSLRADVLRQTVRLGLSALPVVAAGAAFTGAAAALQSVYTISNPLLPRSTVGLAVTPAIVMELATIVTSFLLVGRLTARVASEVAAMRAGEQLDAIETMGLSAPVRVVAPRLLAGTLSFPLLYLVAAPLGVAAAAFMGSATGFLTISEFIEGARRSSTPFDPVFGLIKSVVFGSVLAGVGCVYGYRAAPSSEGVGDAATDASVAATVLVLALDWALTLLLL